MIVDIQGLQEAPLAGPYAACIAGAGMAGIVLANALAAKGHRVLLLEAGGWTWSDESQEIYRGENIGLGYHELDVARWRFLGGTSSHWAGWCRPLDDYDFRPFDHIADSGWPIGIEDISPYLEEASDILELDPFPADTGLPGAEGQLKEVFYRFSGGGGPKTVRFNDKYGKSLEQSELIDVLLHANVVEIAEDPDSGRIQSFKFRDYRTHGPVHQAVADVYVLALGGIENPRALLNANKRRQNGLGNQHDHVGRHFMEHPVFNVGQYVPNPEQDRYGKELRFVAPTESLKAEERTGNWSARVDKVKVIGGDGVYHEVKEGIRRGICVTDTTVRLVRGLRPNFTCLTTPRPTDELNVGAGRLEVAAEQAPNWDSRVVLVDDLDRFGHRRIALDWRLTDMDKLTFRRSVSLLGEHFARHNLGRVRIADWLFEDDAYFPSPEDGEEVGGFHHLGTTRMAGSPRFGVVDPNCRMFESDNLYMAGSSVFPTGGYANPTLTIMQLTLRLADHLSGRLA